MRKLCLLLALLVPLTACGAPARPEETPEPEGEARGEPWDPAGCREELSDFILSDGLYLYMDYFDAVYFGRGPCRDVREDCCAQHEAHRYELHYENGDVLTMRVRGAEPEEKTYVEDSRLIGAQIRSAGTETARGARVGDSLESVCRLYGVDPGSVGGIDGETLRLCGPDAAEGYDSSFCLRAGDSNEDSRASQALIFLFRDDMLTSIILRGGEADGGAPRVFPPLPPPAAGEAIKVSAPVPIPRDIGALLPEQEFEVGSIWGTREPDGRVMLLLSADSGGAVSAALYDAGRLKDGLGYTMPADELERLLAETEPRTVKFTARSAGEGKFYGEADGITLTVDGDTLSFSDSGLDIDLIRLTEDEALLAWARMPLFEEEIMVPVALEGRLSDLLEEYGGAVELGEYRQYFDLQTDELSMFGPVYDSDGGEMYSVFFYSSRDNGGRRLTVRGIEIGDSALDVAARFPNGGRLPYGDDSGEAGQLYGSSWFTGYFGSIDYTDGGVPEVMIYSTGSRFIKLYFDGAGYLREIAFTLERW